jgi:hypothetical protein
LFATLLVLFIKTTVPQSPGNNRLARTSPSAGRPLFGISSAAVHHFKGC